MLPARLVARKELRERDDVVGTKGTKGTVGTRAVKSANAANAANAKTSKATKAAKATPEVIPEDTAMPTLPEAVGLGLPTLSGALGVAGVNPLQAMNPLAALTNPVVPPMNPTSLLQANPLAALTNPVVPPMNPTSLLKANPLTALTNPMNPVKL